MNNFSRRSPVYLPLLTWQSDELFNKDLVDILIDNIIATEEDLNMDDIYVPNAGLLGGVSLNDNAIYTFIIRVGSDFESIDIKFYIKDQYVITEFVTITINNFYRYIFVRNLLNDVIGKLPIYSVLDKTKQNKIEFKLMGS